eukprot:5320675-Amphidinium_carterae.1
MEATICLWTGTSSHGEPCAHLSSSTSYQHQQLSIVQWDLRNPDYPTLIFVLDKSATLEQQQIYIPKQITHANQTTGHDALLRTTIEFPPLAQAELELEVLQESWMPYNLAILLQRSSMQVLPWIWTQDSHLETDDVSESLVTLI